MPSSCTANAFGFVLRKNHATRSVLGIFDFDKRGRRIDDVTRRLARGEELFDRERASGSDLGELNTGVGARGARLMPYRVALATDDDVVPRPGQRAKRDLISHRSRRQPKRGFLSEQGRDLFLQQVDSGIFAVLIVADRSRGDGGAHLLRGTSDGVRTQVDRSNRMLHVASTYDSDGPKCRAGWVWLP